MGFAIVVVCTALFTLLLLAVYRQYVESVLRERCAYPYQPFDHYRLHRWIKVVVCPAEHAEEYWKPMEEAFDDLYCWAESLSSRSEYEMMNLTPFPWKKKWFIEAKKDREEKNDKFTPIFCAIERLIKQREEAEKILDRVSRILGEELLRADPNDTFWRNCKDQLQRFRVGKKHQKHWGNFKRNLEIFENDIFSYRIAEDSCQFARST